MNKTIIALLLVAAVGGTLYLFSDKIACMKPGPQPGVKEKIIAGWKTDSVHRVKMDTIQDIDGMLLCTDSNRLCNNMSLSFSANGFVYKEADRLQKADTFQYEWKTDSVFTWKSDSAQVLLTVRKLTADSLVLETGTHERIWFHKLLEKQSGFTS